MIFIKNIGPDFFQQLHASCVADGYSPHEYFVPINTNIRGQLASWYTTQLSDGTYRMIIAGSHLYTVGEGSVTGCIKWVESICDTFDRQICKSTNSFLHGGQSDTRNFVNDRAHSIASYDVLQADSITNLIVRETDMLDPMISELYLQYCNARDGDEIIVYSINDKSTKIPERVFDIRFNAVALRVKDPVVQSLMKLNKVNVENVDI